MKTKILLIGAVALIFCLLLFLRGAPGQRKNVARDHEASPASQGLGQAAQSKPTPEIPAAVAGVSATVPIPSPASQVADPPKEKLPALSEGSELHKEQVLALWQGAIEFYGKVVDESSNAVAGANVQFRWMETPTEDGEKRSATESGQDGLFSLYGKAGRSLTVSVSKGGYYASHGGQQTFLYGALDAKFTPDSQRPVIFQLRKKGERVSLVALRRNYQIPRDGTPLSIDLATGASIAGEKGNLIVQCWTDDQGKRSGQKYDWHCLVTVPAGGLALSSEEFPFVAPENGYVPSTEIKMPADRSDWTDDVELKFFYQLPGGLYGRMALSIVAGGEHFCTVDSFLNPSGSRNLEPMEVNPQGPALPPGVREVIPEFK